ncbi:MAG: hypothetical protein ABEH56_05045 [Salinirussus sp.]
MIGPDVTDRSAPDRKPRSGRRKSVLFCPTCGSKSVAGEWGAKARPGGTDIYCPECRSRLSHRSGTSPGETGVEGAK